MPCGVMRRARRRCVLCVAGSSRLELEREVAFCDVRAERDGRVMFADAKGRTSAPGLDIDTMYGQLLRRMPFDLVGQAEFAVVVPSTAVAAVQRVPAHVRVLPGIEVYSVDEQGAVVHHPHFGQGEPPTP